MTNNEDLLPLRLMKHCTSEGKKKDNCHRPKSEHTYWVKDYPKIMKLPFLPLQLVT